VGVTSLPKSKKIGGKRKGGGPFKQEIGNGERRHGTYEGKKAREKKNNGGGKEEIEEDPSFWGKGVTESQTARKRN